MSRAFAAVAPPALAESGYGGAASGRPGETEDDRVDDIGQAFAWGTFLAGVALVALLVFAIIWVAIRQPVKMSARLVPTSAVVQ